MDETTHKLQEVRLQGALDKIEARLDGMDRALALSQQWPTELEKRLAQLNTLLDQRFANLDSVLTERDRLYNERTELLQRIFQQQHDANVKLLSQRYDASEAAVEKAELSMREQLGKVETINNTYNQSLSERITITKDSVLALESRIKGGAQLWGFLLGGAGFIVILLSFIAMMQS